MDTSPSKSTEKSRGVRATAEFGQIRTNESKSERQQCGEEALRVMQEQMPIVTSGLCRELPQACIPPQTKSRIPISDDKHVCGFVVGSRTRCRNRMLYQMHFAGEHNDSPCRLEMRSTSIPHRPHGLLTYEPPPRRHCAEPGLPFPVGGVSIGSSADPPPTTGHHSWLQWWPTPLLLVGMLQPRMLGHPSWGDGKAGDSLQKLSLFLLFPNW